jgi:hypothetical protein
MPTEWRYGLLLAESAPAMEFLKREMTAIPLKIWMVLPDIQSMKPYAQP